MVGLDFTRPGFGRTPGAPSPFAEPGRWKTCEGPRLCEPCAMKCCAGGAEGGTVQGGTGGGWGAHARSQSRPRGSAHRDAQRFASGGMYAPVWRMRCSALDARALVKNRSGTRSTPECLLAAATAQAQHLAPVLVPGLLAHLVEVPGHGKLTAAWLEAAPDMFWDRRRDCVFSCASPSGLGRHHVARLGGRSPDLRALAPRVAPWPALATVARTEGPRCFRDRCSLEESRLPHVPWRPNRGIHVSGRCRRSGAADRNGVGSQTPPDTRDSSPCGMRSARSGGLVSSGQHRNAARWATF